MKISSTSPNKRLDSFLGSTLRRARQLGLSMKKSALQVCITYVLFALLNLPALAGNLSVENKKELTVFGLRSLGMQSGIGDVKKVLSKAEIEELVSTGINLNGFLCAKITDISALKVKGAYEVTCVANRGGTAKKTYLLESLKGIASEM